MNERTSTGLLAKRVRSRSTVVTLEAHLLTTEEVADRIFFSGSRWLTAILRFFRLESTDGDRFRKHLRIAALVHDIGKANREFQAAVAGRGVTQTIRHEHLSTLFLHHPAIAEWLGACGLDHDAICAAVLSHHLKAGGDEWPFCQPRTSPDVRFHFDDPQVQRIIDRLAGLTDCQPPNLGALAPAFRDPSWQEAKKRVLAAARRFGRVDGTRRAFALALKTGLIAADAAASGLVREGYSLAEWIDQTVHSRALLAEDVQNDLIAPRVAALERQTRSTFAPHRFQQGASLLPARALLLAPCGSGKTLAAWYWAERQLARSAAGRVVFLYPTRGTATEGFRDYVGWAPEGKAELLQGTARYELQEISMNPPESLRGKNLAEEAEARLFALRLWGKRYFSATVDQFLAFMEHRYESLCLVPVLADALVVLDEIHSYDAKLFATLLDFLRHFDGPVLGMTATMPPSRLAQLERIGLRVYPNPAERAELADLARSEEHPRYRVVRVGTWEEALERAIDAFGRAARVLWVVNVVRRCQDIAEVLRSRLGAECAERLIVYHSRFRLADRHRAHERTVAAFQADAGAAIAVTTQVCEMSLDLDADVLITECAPIPSLVQRFGRANRHMKHGCSFRADLVLYQPESPRPYDKEDLQAATAFLADLPESPSQRDLAVKLEQHAPRERGAAMGLSRFLTGGYYAVPGDLRDSDDFTSPCVLDADVRDVATLIRQKRPIDGFVLSVPKRFVAQAPPEAGLPTWLGIAPAAQYNAWLGFLERSLGEVH